jgi:DNA-binding MarR family transcriptional regulator
MALWATKGDGLPHKDIVEAMGVTRATVSGLMAALEREGFVRSTIDRDDRRKLIAR